MRTLNACLDSLGAGLQNEGECKAEHNFKKCLSRLWLPRQVAEIGLAEQAPFSTCLMFLVFGRPSCQVRDARNVSCARVPRDCSAERWALYDSSTTTFFWGEPPRDLGPPPIFPPTPTPSLPSPNPPNQTTSNQTTRRLERAETRGRSQGQPMADVSALREAFDRLLQRQPGRQAPRKRREVPLRARGLPESWMCLCVCV